MTIDEAIDILTLKSQGRDIMPKKMEIEAEKLGVEALKRHKERRQRSPHLPHLLLPGETTGEERG